MKNIAVFCGSSLGSAPKIIEDLRILGKTLAKEDIGLVYGGSRIGLMGEVANAALQSGGRVIGVIPKFLKTKEIVHTNLTELIVTDNMHDRKIIMYEKSDGFLILPGGFGTMDEFFEISTWGQLGLHSKPVGILNTYGFYSDLLKQFDKMVTLGFLDAANLEGLIVSEDAMDIINNMRNFKPLPKPAWLNIEGI